MHNLFILSAGQCVLGFGHGSATEPFFLTDLKLELQELELALSGLDSALDLDVLFGFNHEGPRARVQLSFGGLAALVVGPVQAPGDVRRQVGGLDALQAEVSETVNLRKEGGRQKAVWMGE